MAEGTGDLSTRSVGLMLQGRGKPATLGVRWPLHAETGRGSVAPAVDAAFHVRPKIEGYGNV
jgi:hypothetical protein